MYQTLSTKYFQSLINASWEVAKKNSAFSVSDHGFFMTGWKCANFRQLPMPVIYRFFPTAAAVHTGITAQNLFHSTIIYPWGYLGCPKKSNWIFRFKSFEKGICNNLIAKIQYIHSMIRSVWKKFWENSQFAAVSSPPLFLLLLHFCCFYGSARDWESPKHRRGREGGGGVKMISTTATGCLVPTDQLSDALFEAFGFDIGDQKLDRQ